MAGGLIVSASSVTGIFGTGDGVNLFSNTLTINRAQGGLGSKGTTFKWDNFESSTLAAQMSTQGYSVGANAQYRNGATPPVIVADIAHSGTQSAKMTYTAVPADGTFPAIYVDPGANTLEAYFACWGRWDGAGSTGVMKLCRMTPGAYGSQPQSNTTYFDWSPADGLIDQTDMSWVSVGTSNYTEFQGERGPGSNFDRDSWHFLEWYYRYSTPGVADGAWYSWIDGSQHANFSNVVTRASSESSAFIRMIMTLFDGMDQNTAAHNMWQDEIAVERGDATTPFNGRRLIGTNNATYASSTNWAFQPTSTWMDTQIVQAVGTFNKGSFTSGQTMYIHAFTSPTTSILLGSVTVP